MRKRTFVIISSLALAALLAGGGLVVAYMYFSNTNTNSSEHLNVIINEDDDTNANSIINGVNEQYDDNNNTVVTNSNGNNGTNTQSTQTTSQIISEEDTTSAISALETGLLSNGNDDDALKILEYADIDSIKNESSDTNNILYWLYQVEQGDPEGYLATTNLSIFNMMDESGEYERINGDLTLTSTGSVICSTRTDVLIEKETNNKAAELRYVIKQNPKTGKLVSLEADVQMFDTGKRINESTPDNENANKSDVEIVDNAAPIQRMPPKNR